MSFSIFYIVYIFELSKGVSSILLQIALIGVICLERKCASEKVGPELQNSSTPVWL